LHHLRHESGVLPVVRPALRQAADELEVGQLRAELLNLLQVEQVRVRARAVVEPDRPVDAVGNQLPEQAEDRGQPGAAADADDPPVGGLLQREGAVRPVQLQLVTDSQLLVQQSGEVPAGVLLDQELQRLPGQVRHRERSVPVVPGDPDVGVLARLEDERGRLDQVQPQRHDVAGDRLDRRDRGP
jgi:hypothetical protein